MFCSSSECKGEDKVIQEQGDVIAAEGDTVTLYCKYETTSAYAYLFWYKQDVNDYPKYVLRRDASGTENAQEFPKDRFDAELNKTSVSLKIQKLQLSDSAVYYCALFSIFSSCVAPTVMKLCALYTCCTLNDNKSMSLSTKPTTLTKQHS
uniref:Ig-like domain-containing protein n=1 Tax=Maylandia zebra TaxID=106582 RepID=A0A3P9CE36_9CICH